MRNQETQENVITPNKEESKTILKLLHDRGILTLIRDDVDSRMKLIELGLTMPKERDHWLVFDSVPEETMYMFIRFHNPARTRANSRLVTFRFDYAKYRSNPLAAAFGSGEASGLIRRALAVLTGLDLTKFAIAFQNHSKN